jgi:protein-L-isoaspartate(D-aspartate) O-methyltransferase
MNDTSTTTPASQSLRAAMVDRVKQAGWAQTASVEHAMQTVPRHLFVPDTPLTDAYDEQAVITKTGLDGAALSCASVPGIVAMMLDQLQVNPGDHILEIGAGTGYNAALLAELTGPAGRVTTVDIDSDITTQARRALDATGHQGVYVATRDGALGDPDRAPYDRIIVTVGAFDIPPAWWTQLAPGGRLVVPLRWRGQTRSVAFTYHDDRLRSDSLHLCGFVPMLGQDGERTTHLDPDHHVALYYDSDQTINPDALRGVLDQSKTTRWSTTTVGAEDPFDGVWLRLTATEPGTCRIAADQAAVDSGLCTPAIPIRSPALAEHDSLAYFTIERVAEGASQWKLGATGHGPTGPELADRLCTHISAWDRNRGAQPVLTAYPAKSQDTPPDQHAIAKQFSTLTVAY